ncbi:phosphoribosylformylglycinamidine cyclo-ligase [Limnoraphis robusta]|uniref:phosphoribosylformylglycinamidine cyclo-ligase n=1 Tax=Limnoraphis robusta TaxID=1118279 RepID=UPI002B1F8182|nr:phosphoribosylformylglycinamidine cyclo-ligase [Limnoraphis robusta]MEA5497607.1 phosphoribosylformylglycinamidine cyclo-ligase [Limnoraphis robusta BA-68 BA1]
MDYREAGVDVAAGRDFVERIRQSVQSTYRPEVLGGLGGFGGCFEIPTGYQHPVLVSGTDGVGTKLKLATQLNRHHSVGIDLVAMCVNDVLTCGAEPLFFLDYLATGKLNPEQLVQVVEGIAEGCQQAGCALIGGETAEMPGFYPVGEYDLAGFCVGIVEKSQILNGSQVKLGDVAIGLASSGVHSNGFSLVRKIVSDRQLSWEDCPAEFGGLSLGELCLTPTKIYVKPVLNALKSGLEVHGMAHITGGGLPENLPRCLGPDQSIRIIPNSWQNLPIFEWISQTGNVNQTAMWETFNMGIGYVLIVSPHQAEETINYFESCQISAYQIGEVIIGSKELIISDQL